MVKRGLVFAFGLTLALAVQPALAASLSATAPPLVDPGPGYTFSVDLVLDLAGGEEASIFEGSFHLLGVSATIDAFAAGPTWPNTAGFVLNGARRANLSLTSDNLGGSRLLATLTVTWGPYPGVLNVVAADAFAQMDLDEPPLIMDVPIDNVGEVIASIPEAGTAILVGLGGLALLAFARTKRRARG